MNANGQNKLNNIKWEVDSIIKDLDGIANGLNRDFHNIGNDICATKIRDVRNRFISVKKKLNSIDSNNIEEV